MPNAKSNNPNNVPLHGDVSKYSKREAAMKLTLDASDAVELMHTLGNDIIRCECLGATDQLECQVIQIKAIIRQAQKDIKLLESFIELNDELKHCMKV